jgi:hypothetical protein
MAGGEEPQGPRHAKLVLSFPLAACSCSACGLRPAYAHPPMMVTLFTHRR